MRVLFLIMYFLVILLIYFFIENRMLIVRKYKIKTEIPSGIAPLKIVQLSDIHKRTYKNGWARLVLRIKSLEPDIILITGDLVSRSVQDFEYTGALLKKLSSICPVYCCLGNHELDFTDKQMEDYMKMINQSGAVLLDNETAVYKKNGKTINITGASLKLSCYKNKDGKYSDLHYYSEREIRNDLGEKSGFTILLAHNPFFSDAYAHWGAELTFSGHVHGGAVRLPFIGGLLSPERKFFPEKSLGVYETNGKKLVVSAGIGKYRLFNPPEILYAEIESE